MTATALLLKPLETAISQLLRLDPEAAARLRPLIGRTLAVELAGPDLRFRCRFEAGGVRLAPTGEDDPAADASVRLTPTAALSLIRSQGENAQGVEFQGDVGVVHAVRRLAAGLEIDWEEQLSRVTGDIVAHQIGQTVRGFTGWLRQGQQAFERNLADYLTEENRSLPARAEVEGFLADVDRLRAGVDRLAARLDRLERKPK